METTGQNKRFMLDTGYIPIENVGAFNFVMNVYGVQLPVVTDTREGPNVSKTLPPMPWGTIFTDGMGDISSARVYREGDRFGVKIIYLDASRRYEPLGSIIEGVIAATRRTMGRSITPVNL